MPAGVCAIVSDQLDDWARQRLGPGSRAAVESHLAGCLRCRQQAEDLRLVRSVLERVPVPQLLGRLRGGEARGGPAAG